MITSMIKLISNNKGQLLPEVGIGLTLVALSAAGGFYLLRDGYVRLMCSLSLFEQTRRELERTTFEKGETVILRKKSCGRFQISITLPRIEKLSHE